jgi:hypothetical protein
MGIGWWPFGGTSTSTDSVGTATVAAREFTPRHLIAGTAMVADVANAREAAYYSAVAALDTELVRIVHAADGKGRVHYLAAPASDFVSAGGAVATGLAAALPGIAGHAGDGGYFAQTEDGRTAVVVLHGDKLTSFIGKPEEAERFVGNKLGVNRVAISPTTPQWEGMREAQVRLPRMILAGLSLLMAALAIAAMIAAVVLATLAARSSNEIDKQIAEYRQRMTTSAQQAQAVMRPLGGLGELERLAWFAATNGGTLKTFKYDKGRIEWRFEAPATLGPKQLAELGDVRSKQGQGVLIIEKGENAR